MSPPVSDPDYDRLDVLLDTDPIALLDEHRLALRENEELRRIVCHLHPADAPDPLTLRLARLELGEGTARLFCQVIGANHD